MLFPEPHLEARFYELVREFFDLERDTARHYGHGEYTLARMGTLAELAGHPEERLRVIHVAGTKGKGTTCFFLEALLASAGLACGTYSSPHLLTVRERFRLKGKPVSYTRLLAETERLSRRVAEAGVHPTLFEFMTVLAMRLFAGDGCTHAVVETGIGGLLDATNYIPHPAACAITSVSFDHVQLLGHTIAEIAAQKAGIIKPGAPVVLADQPYPDAAAIMRETARRQQAPCHPPAPEDACAIWPVGDLPAFLRENFRTALGVCDVLGIRPDPRRFCLPPRPGRFQLLRTDPPVVIDAAHNADSAARLAEALRARYGATRFVTVLGIVSGKDVAGILAALRPVTAEFLFTHPRTSYKGSELDTLVRTAGELGVRFRVIPTIGEPADLPSDEPLLFTGSFFTAAIGADLFGRG